MGKKHSNGKIITPTVDNVLEDVYQGINFELSSKVGREVFQQAPVITSVGPNPFNTIIRTEP